MLENNNTLSFISYIRYCVLVSKEEGDGFEAALASSSAPPDSIEPDGSCHNIEQRGGINKLCAKSRQNLHEDPFGPINWRSRQKNRYFTVRLTVLRSL